MKFLIELLIVLFLLSPIFSFGGETNGIKYKDKTTSLVKPSEVCFPPDKYEMLNMMEFVEKESGRLCTGVLLHIPGTDIDVVLVVYQDNQELWLMAYKIGDRLYVMNGDIYMEFDQDEHVFKDKRV